VEEVSEVSEVGGALQGKKEGANMTPGKLKNKKGQGIIGSSL
jgi:hypothetical protein